MASYGSFYVSARLGRGGARARVSTRLWALVDPSHPRRHFL